MGVERIPKLESAQKVDPGEENSPAAPTGICPGPFSLESGALTTELSPSHVYVRAGALGCFQSYWYPNLSEGADRVGGQLRGDRVPLKWRNQIWQSLEERAGKRCSECAQYVVTTTSTNVL